jgi:hypothetical protein
MNCHPGSDLDGRGVGCSRSGCCGYAFATAGTAATERIQASISKLGFAFASPEQADGIFEAGTQSDHLDAMGGIGKTYTRAGLWFSLLPSIIGLEIC